MSVLKRGPARERQRFGVAGDNSPGTFIKDQESRALVSSTVVPMTTPCAGNGSFRAFRLHMFWRSFGGRLFWLRLFWLGFLFRWLGFRRFWSRGCAGSLRYF